jgi:hypothetical protein
MTTLCRRAVHTTRRRLIFGLRLAGCVIAVFAALTSAASANTRTWSGAVSGLWSNAGNWDGAVSAGDDLVFPVSASNKASTNDFSAGTSFTSITFNGTGYSLSGNAITLGTGGILQSNAAYGTNAINLSLTVDAVRPVAFANSGGGAVYLSGVISGTGGLNVTTTASAQYELFLQAANGYSGGTSLTGVFCAAETNTAFGTGPVVNNDSTIYINGHSIGNAISVKGGGISGNAAIAGAGTWSGPITLTGQTSLGADLSSGLTISGTIAGSFLFSAPQNYAQSRVTLITASPGFTGALGVIQGTLYVDAAFANGSADLTNGTVATFAGTGSIGGPLLSGNNKTIAPGHDGPGVFSSGSLTIPSGSTLKVDLNGLAAGTGYDQLNVTGSVTLGGTLIVSPGFVPSNGATFTIVNNDGSDAVSGTFAGLPQGGTIVGGGRLFTISYTGGTGNDVVLTAGGSAAPYDFNTDSKTDFTVFRPSNGVWYSALNGGGAAATIWGAPTDVDVAADFDGDGRTDIAAWRPSTGYWYIVYSSDQSVHGIQWGATGDIPLTGDADGDGRADLIIYRPSNGVWYFKLSTGDIRILQWGGTNGDQPLVGDFDHDGSVDAAIYRPSAGTWFVALAAGGTQLIGWGNSTDTPVTGDFDGDGKADAAVFRSSTGQWFINRSSGGAVVVTWGVAGDIPVTGDWDNDGKTDFAVWRPSTGVWYVQLSGGGALAVTWGVSTDKVQGRLPGS